MRFVWQWDPVAIIYSVVALFLGMLSLRAIAWMNARKIQTWGDLITWPSRIRRYNEAVAHGGVPCHCNWGRVYHERRNQTPDGAGILIYVTTRPCVSCCGVGARLPEPQPIASLR